MPTLAIEFSEGLTVPQLALRSAQGLDAPLAFDAELLVALPLDAGRVLGTLQRTTEATGQLDLPLYRRGSGGAEARVGPGTVWLQLRLARPSALVACVPAQILNRYVRPLLRGLGRAGAPARYFGRDWISVAHRPAGLVGLAHDGSTGRALFEAFVAVDTPFAERGRASFLGKEPGTLREIAYARALAGGRSPADVGLAIASAYREPSDSNESIVVVAAPPHSLAVASAPPLADRDTPWTAVREEAIGLVGAGRDAAGRVRLGGELMASRDAIARLEDAIAALASNAGQAEVGAAVETALSAPGVALVGVRSLASVRDAIVEALGAGQ